MIDNPVLCHIDHLLLIVVSSSVIAIPRLELYLSLIVPHRTAKDRKGHPDTVFPPDVPYTCYRIHLALINRNPAATANQETLVDSSCSKRGDKIRLQSSPVHHNRVLNLYGCRLLSRVSGRAPDLHGKGRGFKKQHQQKCCQKKDRQAECCFNCQTAPGTAGYTFPKS